MVNKTSTAALACESQELGIECMLWVPAVIPIGNLLCGLFTLPASWLFWCLISLYGRGNMAMAAHITSGVQAGHPVAEAYICGCMRSCDH